MKNNIFIKCKKAISAPATADLEMERNKIIDTEQGLELRGEKFIKEKLHQKWWVKYLILPIAVVIIGTMISNFLIKRYFSFEELSTYKSNKTVDINDSRGIKFLDSIIHGGLNINKGNEIEIEKTRISP